jgi:hypothetical protein
MTRRLTLGVTGPLDAVLFEPVLDAFAAGLAPGDAAAGGASDFGAVVGVAGAVLEQPASAMVTTSASVAEVKRPIDIPPTVRVPRGHGNAASFHTARAKRGQGFAGQFGEMFERFKQWH